MADFFALAFTQPLLLLGLLGLPLLWLLLRITPPQAREIRFPPLSLILDLMPAQKTAARTPWWLTALRLVMAALVIIALAGPLWRPPQQSILAPNHPLLILMDDGWASAADWPLRLAAADAALKRAGREERPAALLATAPGLDAAPPRVIGPMPAGDLAARLAALRDTVFRFNPRDLGLR
jgi:hypothetical protein